MAKTDGETVRPATPSDDRDEPTATGDREVSATAADLDEQTPAADDAEAPDDAEARDDGEDDAPRRRIRLGGGRAPTGAVRRVLSVVLVVALLAGVVATVVFGARWYRQRQIDEAHDQALAAARQECVNFVSISASSVDSDLQRILSGATGQFKDEFTRSMPQVRSAVMENNVESKGSALAAALVTGDRDSATVLVAVDATVKNTHAEDGRLSHYRIQVDLARDSRSGKWLVSKLQFVG
ncbi:MAG TPA: hypothetical protein VF054_06520 [Micromonosporaceae bacterium]